MMHCIHDKLPGKNMQNILCTKCTVLSENVGVNGGKTAENN